VLEPGEIDKTRKATNGNVARVNERFSEEIAVILNLLIIDVPVFFYGVPAALSQIG
jgi:hypothetical protein